MMTDPSGGSTFQLRHAHIYYPQTKHVHNHPANKTIGTHWVVDFDTTSTYKSPLMGWTSATTDSFHSKGDNLQTAFPSAESAVSYCQMNGWGYTISYPKYKYHTLKMYANNFAYKGEPKPKVDYD